MGAAGVTEEEKRQARIGVMTNVATFAAIVFALRVGKGKCARHKTVQCYGEWGCGTMYSYSPLRWCLNIA